MPSALLEFFNLLMAATMEGDIPQVQVMIYILVEL